MMKYTITVVVTVDAEDGEDVEEVAEEVRHVASLIEDGYTSGRLNLGHWDSATEES
jgi:DNA-binding Lrp family transcriptional regulator